jgi:RNA polymerase-interacting CarD/CdnL/TRCF family regulator
MEGVGRVPLAAREAHPKGRVATEYGVCMKLAVGDVVVYANHGPGSVAARKTQTMAGGTREVVVVELDEGLTVTLPLELAEKLLRPLASEADLHVVQETLRGDSALSVDPWLSRRKEMLDKLTGGSPVQLAEIVSEGAQRERERRAKGAKPQASTSEREVFVKARRLLADEIALTRGIQPAAAEGWIEEQLTRPDLSPPTAS